MHKLAWLLRVVGVIQLALGILYLFFPDWLLTAMGHTLPPVDLHYPLAMLAARFIAYGIGFYLIARAPAEHTLWINLMILIQCIDLAAGIFYTTTGVVSLGLSGFAMFNACWIIVLLTLWHPRRAPRTV
jgi:hypothetical protein